MPNILSFVICLTGNHSLKIHSNPPSKPLVEDITRTSVPAYI